jgi:hypothetical protein
VGNFKNKWSAKNSGVVRYTKAKPHGTRTKLTAIQAQLLLKVCITNTSQCAFVIFEGARATPVTSDVRKHKLREFHHAGLNIQPGGKDKAGK